MLVFHVSAPSLLSTSRRFMVSPLCLLLIRTRHKNVPTFTQCRTKWYIQYQFDFVFWLDGALKCLSHFPITKVVHQEREWGHNSKRSHKSILSRISNPILLMYDVFTKWNLAPAPKSSSSHHNTLETKSEIVFSSPIIKFVGKYLNILISAKAAAAPNRAGPIFLHIFSPRQSCEINAQTWSRVRASPRPEGGK